MFVRVKKTGKYEYLQIVKSQRVNGKIRQKLIGTLGRVDVLKKQGQIDAILTSLAKHAEKSAVLTAHRTGDLSPVKTTRIGPPLLFGHLWKRLGLDEVLGELLAERRFGFSVEKSVFLSVVHRLMVSGSDRAADKWKDGYAFDEDVQKLGLHHLYRAMAWLGESLPDEEQTGATPFALRCQKDLIEEGLFQRNRDLFSEFDLVFFDTTSIYFEGEGGETLGQYGHSKDHRPDCKQIVVGVILDGNGTPVCSELWPGNTTDVKSLLPVVERLRARFAIRRICVVADRGMMSANTIQELEENPDLEIVYILGARMRRVKEVRDEVLSRGGKYQVVHPPRKKSKDPSPLKVKEVWVHDRRYVICHNEEQAAKDREDREAILSSLREALKRGDKSLVGNKGYRKYLQSSGKRFAIDEKKIKEEERFDGKWVLRTNTSLAAADVALKYKQLWMVENVFRTMKSILDSRPVWHKCDETIRGHVFCSFLALVVMKHLQGMIAECGFTTEWADFKRDLDALEEVEVNANGKSFVLRSEARGDVGKVFQAARVALPQTVRILDE